MIKNVLVVDDDQELLLSLTEGLEKYGETFSVLLAGDGQVAVDGGSCGDGGGGVAAGAGGGSHERL